MPGPSVKIAKKKKQPADVIKEQMQGWNIVESLQPMTQDSNPLQGMKASKKPDAVSPELAALRKKFRPPDAEPDEAETKAEDSASPAASTESTTRIVRVTPQKAGLVDDRAQRRSKSVVIKNDEIIGEQG